MISSILFYCTCLSYKYGFFVTPPRFDRCFRWYELLVRFISSICTWAKECKDTFWCIKRHLQHTVWPTHEWGGGVCSFTSLCHLSPPVTKLLRAGRSISRLNNGSLTPNRQRQSHSCTCSCAAQQRGESQKSSVTLCLFGNMVGVNWFSGILFLICRW